MIWVKVTQVSSVCGNSINYTFMLFVIFVGIIYIDKILIKLDLLCFIQTLSPKKNGRKYKKKSILISSIFDLVIYWG